MDLKTFIRETITEIAAGVGSADAELRRSHRGEVWTSDFNTFARDLVGVKIGKGVTGGNKSTPVLFIEFRVKLGVAKESTKTAGGSIGLHVLALDAKGEGARTNQSDSVHEVQFTIPVCLQASRA